jgi:plastocyanin
MKFSTASAVAALSAIAPALVSAVDIPVIVGANADGSAGLVFSPQVITAQVGDIVNFQFRGGNHTVTQSSFANPCAWQFNTATQKNGFNSDFVPFVPASGQVGVYSLEITQVTTPIWFFCGRKPHCKGGMFGAINPPTTGERTFEAFTANVQSTDEPGLPNTVPFTPPPPGGAASSAGSSPTGVVPPPAGAPSVTPPAASSTSSGAAPSGSAPAAGSGAMSVSPRSAVVLGFVGLVASFIL